MPIQNRPACLKCNAKSAFSAPSVLPKRPANTGPMMAVTPNVKKLIDAVPSGSYLAAYDGTDTSPEVVEAARLWNLSAVPQYHLRSAARLAQFFDGLELVEPGLVSVTQWKPEIEMHEIDQYGAVGRKP